jgi:crossover junction endodeoxyribonuclease RuvC
VRILGLDPGLQRTGWGVIELSAGRMTGLACGVLRSDADRPLADRLAQLYEGLERVLADWRPERAAVEETFVNVNPASTLKLGQARAVSLLVPARAGLYVAEYAAKRVKKAVVGGGSATKDQILFLVERLLPGLSIPGADAADALAVAICDAHHVQSLRSTLPRTLAARAMPLAEAAARPARPVKPVPPDLAASLRRSMGDAGDLLWAQLRSRAGFQRHAPVAGMEADFAAPDLALVVELDGGATSRPAAESARRSAALAMAGYRTLRFWQAEVMDNLDGVLAEIDRACAEQGRTP